MAKEAKGHRHRLLISRAKNGRWALAWEGLLPLNFYDTKDNAIWAAKNLVTEFPPGEVFEIVVQHEDGTVRTEWSYKFDPFPKNKNAG